MYELFKKKLTLTNLTFSDIFPLFWFVCLFVCLEYEWPFVMFYRLAVADFELLRNWIGLCDSYCRVKSVWIDELSALRIRSFTPLSALS